MHFQGYVIVILVLILTAIGGFVSGMIWGKKAKRKTD